MNDWIILVLANKLHVVVLLIAFIYALTISKQLQKKIILLSAVAFPLSFVLSRISSYFYFNPRPFVVGEFTPLVQHVADNGFPSDHVLLVATVSMVIFLFNRPIGVGLILISILVGLGRVLSGVHHVVDIIGSFVIAFIAVYISYIFINKFVNKRNNVDTQPRSNIT